MSGHYLHLVWREVSRHLEVGESVATLQTILHDAISTQFLLLRRWDDEHASLRTVGLAGLRDLPARASLAGPTAAAVRAWAAQARSSVWHERTADRVALALVPEGATGPVVVIPLLGMAGIEGVAVLGGLSAFPANLEELTDALGVALRNDARLAELARVREAAEADRRALLTRLGRHELTDGVVGAEGGLKNVMARVAQVAATDVPVLLLGETGSGKEVVARLIHERSGRQRAPFLRVNCGAIPAELVDSELFGHERGAFTGALAPRRGWFERADGGTLFLDEVGELPLAAQVRLLRVLQDGSFQRVGGQESRTADVRILAATHRDLPTLVGTGAFRQDLWFRISVFPLRIPPLRERADDIPALVNHFAAAAGTRLFGVPLSASAADVVMLVAYPWPGNVRELAAVLERAAILGDGQRLEVAAALGASPPVVKAGPTGWWVLGEDEAESPTGPDTAKEIEAMTSAVQECLGRIEGPFGAARKLGVNPHTLRARLRRFGIDWAQYRKV